MMLRLLVVVAGRLQQQILPERERQRGKIPRGLTGFEEGAGRRPEQVRQLGADLIGVRPAPAVVHHEDTAVCDVERPVDEGAFVVATDVRATKP